MEQRQESTPPDQQQPQETIVRPGLSPALKIVFSLALLVAFPLTGEGICRILGLGKQTEVAHYVATWKRGPDGSPFWVVRGAEYNVDGMRDRDHEIEKPPGTFRIICLGDSVTAGHGVSKSQSYPVYFESFLQQIGVPAEVFNIAVSGWSTQQENTAYELIGSKYNADQVFLGFCLNDVAEMNNNMAAPPPKAIATVMRYSALARWIARAEEQQVHSVEELCELPETPAATTGWNRVFTHLLDLKDRVRADGAQLSVIVFPFRFQLEKDSPKPIAQRKLCDFCWENSIPCIDLLPALAKAGPEIMLDESHLTPEGAQIVARELIRWGRSGCEMCGLDVEGKDWQKCPRCKHRLSGGR